MRQILILSCCLCLLAAAAGCSAPSSAPATTVATATPAVTETPNTAPLPTISRESVDANTINIQNMAYSPDTITIKVGQKARWVNRDSVAHTVTFTRESGIAGSGPMSFGQSFSVLFDKPGIYNYSCSYHPVMKGSVIVAWP